MSQTTVTVDDLREILRSCAGVDEQTSLDGDILDTEFADLGYDSLAVLEASSHLQRRYGVQLDDDTVTSATTPRALLAAVNGG